MKKTFLATLLALSATFSAHAQRCEISLNLTTQHNLDTLSAATKSCIIRGITVSGAGIINLEGLAGIESIEGPLYIKENPDLLNLNGLSGLKNVQGEIDINNNAKITSLNGLSSLTTVGNNLRVADNPALVSISALSKITTVPGFLSVGRNATLANYTGLDNLTTVGSSVAFGAAPLLANLDPLSKLTSIGSYLYIGENPSLTSIYGLRNLKTVGNYINIEDNDALTTLSGLDSLDYRTPYYIKIINNALLSVCSVKSICSFLANRYDYLVQLNAEGCNTSSQISTACGSLPVELVSFTGSNNREGNIMQWETSSEINNSGFELQKSRDGKSFDVLAFVPGNGNSKENHRYEHWDNAPYATTYYRLKQLDEDGTYAYSRIVAVKDNFAQFRTNIETTNIFPNPVKDKLTIKVKNLNQPFSIRNFEGKTIKAGKIVPSEPIDVSKITNGLYLVTVGSETFKVLINN